MGGPGGLLHPIPGDARPHPGAAGRAGLGRPPGGSAPPNRARSCGAAPAPSRPAPPNGAAPAPGPPRPAPSRPDGRSAGPHGGAAGAVAAGGRAGGCGGTPASLPRSEPARPRRASGSAAALRLLRPRPRRSVRWGSRGGAAVQPQPGGGGGPSGGAGSGLAVAVAVRGSAGARRGGGAGRAPIPPRAAPDRLLRRGSARSLRQRRRQRPRSAVPLSGECPSPNWERSVPAPHSFSILIPSRLLSAIIPAPSHPYPCIPLSPSRLHSRPHPSPNLHPYPGSHLVSVPTLSWSPSWRSQSGLLSFIPDPIPPLSWLFPRLHHSFVPTQSHFSAQDSLGCVMSTLSHAR